MFRPASLYIGLRYTRAKRRNHFISFISFASMIGIALGILVLITVLSVMNGFDYQIRNKIFGMARQVTVSQLNYRVENWPALAKKIKTDSGVVDVAPFVSGQGLLSHEGMTQPAMITGIAPKQEEKVSNMPSKIVAGSFNSLTAKKYGIILGDGLASDLDLKVGDKVTLLIPKVNVTPMGVAPIFKRFTVVGLFHVGGGFGFDKGSAFINLKDAQVLFNLKSQVNGIRVKVNNLYAAPGVAASLSKLLPSNYTITDWTQEYGAFFRAVSMEKTMMFVILLFIIAIAAFNLVSTLVMVVADKRAEIAILRTFGATPKMIMMIFIVQGGVVGLVGMLLGLIGGVALSLNISRLFDFIQKVFNVQLIPSSVYIVDYLPSRLLWSDVWHVCLIAVLLSLIATIYPAWMASRTQPAEALRYE